MNRVAAGLETGVAQAQCGDAHASSVKTIELCAGFVVRRCSFSDLPAFEPGAITDAARTLQDTLAADPQRSFVEGALAGNGARHRVIWQRGERGDWLGVVADDAAPTEQCSASVDPLTGAGTRAGLAETYAALRARAETSGERLFALFVDLDRFKQVNDTLGHEAGDLLLKRAAKRLSQGSGAHHVARLGGDEFAVLGVSPDGLDHAVDVAERIVELIGRPFLLNGAQISTSASIGVAAHEADDQSAEDLLRRADIALYASKNRGRGRTTVFAPHMARALEERRLLENDLRRALLLDQFELRFQPQFCLKTARLAGFEASPRWRRPNQGLLDPSEFTALAKEMGLLADIGTWCLHEAAAAAAAWPAEWTVAVSVSASHFECVDFVEAVRDMLDRTGLSPKRLELELTEAVFVEDRERARDRMEALRALGVRLSLDDFGADSPLNHLRVFPFDTIKIDKAYIDSTHPPKTAAQIISAISSLGYSLGMNVLTEGVDKQPACGLLLFPSGEAADGPSIDQNQILEFTKTLSKHVGEESVS